jgi:hypothetical protein
LETPRRTRSASRVLGGGPADLYQNYREGIVTRGTPSHNLAVTMTKTPLGMSTTL